MNSFSESTLINAPRETVWEILSDIGSIHKWNPGVIHSRTTTTGEPGPGSGRRCELGGKNYLNEEVVEWIARNTLTMRIIDTNLPFKSADIRFTLEDQGGKTLITVSPKYELKFGILGKFLDRVLVRHQYKKGMINLLQGLKQYVENKQESVQVEN